MKKIISISITVFAFAITGYGSKLINSGIKEPLSHGVLAQLPISVSGYSNLTLMVNLNQRGWDLDVEVYPGEAASQRYILGKAIASWNATEAGVANMTLNLPLSGMDKILVFIRARNVVSGYGTAVTAHWEIWGDPTPTSGASSCWDYATRVVTRTALETHLRTEGLKGYKLVTLEPVTPSTTTSSYIVVMARPTTSGCSP